MTWFKVDDKLTAHRKFLRLGRVHGREVRCMAMGLWVQTGSWSALNETNGFIPDDITEEFAPVTVASHVTDSDAVDVREALCDVGLWSRTTDGFQFEGWSEYQPTKEGADEKRAKDADRKRRSRAQKSGVTPVSAVTDSDTSDVRPCPSPPTRPDPSRPVPKQNSLVHPDEDRDDRFDEFWSAYPRREGKRDAAKAWTKATKRTDPDVILDGVRRYAAAGREKRYTAMPASWLNGQRWTDEVVDSRPEPGHAGGTHVADWLTPSTKAPDYLDAEVVQLKEISR